MSDGKKNESPVMKGLSDAWRNCVLGLKVFLYGIAIVFFIIGILALFGGAIGLGIFLMALNALLVLLFRRLDKWSSRNFDQDFDEMVRRNRGEE